MHDRHTNSAVRHMQSTTWHAIQPYASFNAIDLSRLPHTQLGMSVMSAFVSLILLVSTIVTSKSLRVNTITYWIFTTMQQSVSITSLADTYLVVIVICLFVAVVVKAILVACLAWMNKNGKDESDSAKVIVNALAILCWIDLNMLLVPIVGACIESFIRVPVLLTFFAAVILISLPLELALHNTITFDFNYVSRNMVQGRKYAYQVVCIGGTIICSLVYFSVRDSNNHVLLVLSNCAHVVNSIIRMYLRFKWNPYFYQIWINRVLIIFETFYFCQAIVHLWCLMVPQILKFIYLDYLWLSSWPLLCFALNNMLNRRTRLMFVGKNKFKDDISVENELYALEQVYFAFQNQGDPEKKLSLYAFMINHTKACKDPYCLCFHIRINYDSTIGQAASLKAREVYARYTKGKKQSKQQNTLSFFDDLVAIDALRFHHGSVVSARLVPETKKVQVYSETSILKDNIGSMMNLDNQSDFTRVIASFLRKVLESKSQLYTATMANLAFLMSEYKNPLAALLLAYDFVYSPLYASQSSILREVIFQNFITIAKKDLNSNEGMNIPVHGALHGRSLSDVLDFRERSHKIRFDVQDLIMKKIDVYSALCIKSIDFLEVIKMGDELHKKTMRTEREIDYLLDMSTKNTKLARMGVVFEMCVLERPIVSTRLRKCYKEAYFDCKNRVGSINSVNNKFKFSPFNSSNIVVFSRHFENAFRITSFTTNSIYLFGMKLEDLKGQKLSNFMPDTVASLHDRMMFSYLNGQSQHKHDGKIYVPVLSKQGTMRSAMILIKPELQFFNEIYIAGLISVRKKNHYPLIYSDLHGRILGSNKQAMKMISNNKQLEDSSLFALFPKLYQFYNPGKQQDHSYMKMSPFIDRERHNLSEVTADHTVITNETSSTKHDDFNKEANGALRSKHSIDLFMFQMMHKTITTINFSEMEANEKTPGPGDHVYYSPSNPEEYENVGKLSHMKQSSASKGTNTTIKLDVLSRIISDQRKLILENLTKIFKTKIDVETSHYQKHITIKEITLDTIHKTRHRVQQFFKAFAANNNPYLMEVLMVSPEALNNLYKLCNYKIKLNSLKDELGDNTERDKLQNETIEPGMHVISESIKTSYAFTSMNSKGIVNMKSALDEKGFRHINSKNSMYMESTKNQLIDDEEDVVPVEIRASWIDQREDPQSTTHIPNHQKPLKSKVKPQTDLVLSNIPRIDGDIYHSSLKPIQSDVSVHCDPKSEIFKKEDIELKDSAVHKQNKKEYVDRAFIQEKIRKFNNLVQTLKKDLERDYESTKIQKLSDVILNSMKGNSSGKNTFAAVRQLFGDNANSVGGVSSKGSVDAKGSDFIEGNTLKADDSITSEQDSFEEVNIENSDPLKTIVEKDEPSTFLKSSSKASIKTSQDATLIRNSIQRSHQKLQFRKWEYAMYMLILIICSFKMIFKFMYDNALKDIYNYELSINLISNILRPTAFIYKESLKGWTQQFEDFSMADLPDKQIFYRTQLTYYQERFQDQIVNLTSFFRGDLDLNYTFLQGVPATPVSIFAMTSSLLNSYIRLNAILADVSNQEDRSFIIGNAQTWDQIRNVARDVFLRLYGSFIQQDANRSSKLAVLLLYFGLNYSMNLLVILVATGILVYICHLMHSQLRQAADLLLRIEKSTFRESLKKYSRISVGNRGEGQAEGSRDRKDFRQAVLVHIKHAEYLESENSVLIKDSSNIGRKRGRIRAGFDRDSDLSSLKRYSSFSTFPSINKKSIAVFIMLSFLVVSLPSVANILVMLNYYDTLEASLSTSTAINLSSSSFYFLAAIQYREYASNVIPEAGKMLDSLRVLKEKLTDHIDGAKRIDDPYLRDVLAKTYVCSTLLKEGGSRQRDLCLKSSQAGRDFTVIQGIQQFSLQVHLVSAEVATGSRQDLRVFFSNPEFIYYDLKAFALTVVLKSISTKYMARILTYIYSTSKLTNSLLSTYLILMTMALIAVRWLWIPWRLKNWRKYECTLMMLNDDVISSIYIKSYFGHASL